MDNLNGGNYFIHDAVKDNTQFIGSFYDLKGLNSMSYSGIHHIHKQFETTIY